MFLPATFIEEMPKQKNLISQVSVLYKKLSPFIPLDCDIVCENCLKTAASEQFEI